jgi:hypothetical protein
MQQAEHAKCVVLILRFSENLPAVDNDGVAGHHDGVLPRPDRFISRTGFPLREPLGDLLRRKIILDAFIGVVDRKLDRQAELSDQFLSPWRSGRQDQRHPIHAGSPSLSVSMRCHCRQMGFPLYFTQGTGGTVVSKK